MRQKSLLLLLAVLVMLVYSGCVRPESPPPGPPPGIQAAEGVFLLNEGGYTYGNASVNYFSFKDEQLEEKLFERANGRPLGDVLQSATLHEGLLYLVVNNSERIEVVDPATFELKATITDLVSPRYFLPIGNGQAYVTDLYAEGIQIVDLSSDRKVGFIPLPGWTEELMLIEGEVWVTNRERDHLYILNPGDHQIIDSLQVAPNCSALQLDKDGALWTICSGSLTQDIKGGLFRIDPASRVIERSFPFTDFDIGGWPRLQMNGAGDQLYFLKEDLYTMPVSATSLPATPLVTADGGQIFYGLGVNPDNGEVWLADAIDYQQQGVFFVYSAGGDLLRNVSGGVIPNGVVFY